MKTLAIMIIALFSNYTLANNWKEIIQKHEGYSVRLSYTAEWLPATYGSEGGATAGIFYIDIFSGSDMNASIIEVSEVLKDGRMQKISEFGFLQDHGKHFYARMPRGRSYADQIWASSTYAYKIIVDGKLLEGKFKI